MSGATLAVGLVFEWVAPTDALRAVDLAARSDACWAVSMAASMAAMWVAQRDKSMVGRKACAMVVPWVVRKAA